MEKRVVGITSIKFLKPGQRLVVVFFEHAVDLGEEIGGLGARVDAFAGNFF